VGEGSRTAPIVRPGHLVAGRYRLVSRIGTGAMGAVWLARDQLLGREVAVKQVLSTAGMDAGEATDQRARALREGRIAARLSHPHAITMYDVALDAGEPWLVMEHLPSDSLAGVLASGGVLDVARVAQIGAQLADALAAAHAAGVVHRDVKPGNVLIGRGGRDRGVVKITDFGISRTQGDLDPSRTGPITGTPAYFAPEVARGHAPTGASDVFSLGATLYTALEGVPPFGLDESATALVHRVARGEVVLPQRAGALTDPLLRMLEPDPARRPTMEQARDHLAAVAVGRPGPVTSAAAARPLVRPVGRGARVSGAAGRGGTAAERSRADPAAGRRATGARRISRPTVVTAAVVLAVLVVLTVYLLVAAGPAVL
jgi:serine/threonine protein kinase